MVKVMNSSDYDSLDIQRRVDEVISMLRQQNLFGTISLIKHMNQLLKDIIQQENRSELLLLKTMELLKKQDESPYVLNILEQTVNYDDAECDGSCLVEDIETHLFETGVIEVD